MTHGVRVPECPCIQSHRLPYCILCQLHALVEQRGLACARRGLDQKRGSFARILLRLLQAAMEPTQYSLPSVEVLRFPPVFHVRVWLYEITHGV